MDRLSLRTQLKVVLLIQLLLITSCSFDGENFDSENRKEYVDSDGGNNATEDKEAVPASTPKFSSIFSAQNTSVGTLIKVGDTDENQIYNFNITTSPTNGIATVDTLGLVTYTPDTNFIGKDGLIVTVINNSVPPISNNYVIDIFVFTDAESKYLYHRAFTFSDGGAFDLNLENVPVTLIFLFENKETNIGVFALTALSVLDKDNLPARAEGTVVLDSSCKFDINFSTFPEGTGPQDCSVMIFDTCGVIPDNRTLIIKNIETSIMTFSDPNPLESDRIGVISIRSDRDLESFAQTGNGTLEDPYVISDFILQPSGAARIGLEVWHTTKPFIIRDVTIVGESQEQKGVFDVGLYIANVHNAVFSNLIISGVSSRGIRVSHGSSGITIKDSTITETGTEGIFMIEVYDILLKDNKVSFTGDRGIFFRPPWSNITVSSNEVHHTLTPHFGGEGIEAFGGNDESNSDILFEYNYVHDLADDALEFVGVIGGIMQNNFCVNNAKQGIDLFDGSDNCLIENNVLINNHNCGMRITDSSKNIIRSNLVVNNVPYGIWFEDDSEENQVYDNILINNAFPIKSDIDNNDIIQSSLQIMAENLSRFLELVMKIIRIFF